MDTCFVHTAYNDADEPADLLFIDFWHPDLSNQECLSLAVFNSHLDEYKASRAWLMHDARQSLVASFRLENGDS